MIMVNEKKEKKVPKRRPNPVDDKKQLVIIVAIALIVFLIVFFFLNRQKSDYKKIKLYKNKSLIYTKYEEENEKFPVQVPYVNIKSDAVSAVNKDIDLFVNDFVKSKQCVVTYEYSISGIILSVVVKVVDYAAEFDPTPYFRSYNINLTTREVISDKSLLEFYGISESDVEQLIENKFHSYYDSLIAKGFYEEAECDYDCFLIYRGIDGNYLDKVSYYVDNANLVAFKPFSFYSLLGEEDYFKDDDFKFLLVEGRAE